VPSCSVTTATFFQFLSVDVSRRAASAPAGDKPPASRKCACSMGPCVGHRTVTRRPDDAHMVGAMLPMLVIGVRLIDLVSSPPRRHLV
jgi:hypothetical protein